MLVQFSFKNFGPFKDEAVFDMRAVKSYKEHPYNLILDEKEKMPLLKVAAVYGANASGKTSFIEAYETFVALVQYSFSKKDKDTQKSVLTRYYLPFLFDETTAIDGTEFEGVYHSEGNEYRYGFIFNKMRIEYEWLYKTSLRTNRQTVVFERNSDEISLGASVKKSCEKYISSIDEDVLALSFFSSLKLRNHVFKDALRCVLDILAVSMTCGKEVDFYLEHYFENDFNEVEKKNLIEFLFAIDVGIKDVEVETNNNQVFVYTYHIGRDGNKYKIPLEIESDGTRRAIALYSLVRIAVRRNKGLIIDELDSQLHPLLLKYIVDMFYDEKSSGQLIYTTHNTTLLDRRFMRRDQIWFVEKGDGGVSSLYSLAEFKVRNDSSFEKEYLGGAFGAIPILKEFSFEGD